jgi:hypothetical protein
MAASSGDASPQATSTAQLAARELSKKLTAGKKKKEQCMLNGVRWPEKWNG